jgi:multidrug efflux pump subunit AcrB
VNISELCIRRPVMTILLMASFVLGGIFAYKQLPVAAIPRVEFPTIQVTAQLPGASPETMAASVASILERQFSTIAGVTTMTSTSSLGNTSIVLSSTSTGTSTAPRSTFSRRSPRPCADCRPR